jgi:hypothetical protein
VLQKHIRSLALAALTGLLSALLAGVAYAEKLLPTDEAAENPSFLAFRQRLITAVREKDHQYVVSILAPNISLGFSGAKGVRAFRKEWRPERKDSKLWPTLQSLLSLGGSFDEDGEFVAPYVYSKFPEGLDSLDDHCIIGKDVRVRSGPSATAPIIATLSYDIVQPATPAVTHATEWVKITTPDGQSGYVSRRFLRSAMDYRASFAKVKGQWKMNFLVAGD